MFDDSSVEVMNDFNALSLSQTIME